MSDHLPRWSAPFFGIVLGVVVAVAAIGTSNEILWEWAALFGFTLGGGAGLLILLLEPSPPKEPVIARAPALGERFLVFVGLLLSPVPVVGLCMSVAAFLATREYPGWPRVASVIALAIGGASTGAT